MYERLSSLIGQVCEEEGVELEDIYDMPKVDNQDMVVQLEKSFGIELPDDYKYFLKTYGSGGMNDYDFFGIESRAKDVSQCTVALMTAECRKKGMPNNLVAILHGGDYVTCIDTIGDSNSQIVTWSWFDAGKVIKIANNFEEYFIEKLEDYL